MSRSSTPAQSRCIGEDERLYLGQAVRAAGGDGIARVRVDPIKMIFNGFVARPLSL